MRPGSGVRAAPSGGEGRAAAPRAWESCAASGAGRAELGSRGD